MQIFFKNILIPVDFSINTEVAVKKAIEFAEQGSNIYLLHVTGAVNSSTKLSPRSFFQVKRTEHYHKVERKINEWKKSIIDSCNAEKVFSILVKDQSVQQTIINTAKRLSIDLIIIGKNSNHKWLPLLNTVIPSKLAKQTGSVVLTLKPGAIYNKAKTVIIPITSENITRKASVIHAICKKAPIKIQLLAFMNEEEKRDGHYAGVIVQLYQTLKASLNCQVEYTFVTKHNKAKTILDFAKKYDADILVVNPETETKLGWPNKYISDVLPIGSKLQVWAV